MFSQLQWSLKMPIALLMPLFLAHRVQQRASSCFRQKLFKCQIYSVATKVLTTMTLGYFTACHCRLFSARTMYLQPRAIYIFAAWLPVRP